MNEGDIYLVLGNAHAQWSDFVLTIIFAGGFFSLMAAKFTGQLVDKTTFFPKKPKIILLFGLLGVLLGAWYGYANCINAAYSIRCVESSKFIILEYPISIIKIPATSIKQTYALISYRGGNSWRLRYYSNGMRYDTIQLGIPEVQAARNFSTRCGVLNMERNE